MLASRPLEDAVDVKLPAFTAVERALASGQVRTKRAQLLNVGQQFPTDRFSIRLGQPGHLGYCIIKDFGHGQTIAYRRSTGQSDRSSRVAPTAALAA